MALGAGTRPRNVVRMGAQSSTDSGTAAPLQVERPRRAPRTLAEDLRWRDDAELTELLRARPDLLEPVPANLSRLAAHASSTASVSAALDSLDRPTLQVLARLSMQPQAISMAGLAAACGVPRWSELIPVIETLRSRALVWGGVPDAPEATLQAVVAVREVVRGGDVPGPIDLCLRIPVALIGQRTADDSCVPSGSSGEGSRALVAINAVREICAAWSQEPPSLLRSGGVGQREMAMVCDRSGCGPAEAGFWIRLTQAAGFVRFEQATVGSVNGRDIARWTQRPYSGQWAELVRAWMLDSESPGLARTKQLMFAWWTSLGAGSMIVVDEFVAALEESGPRGNSAGFRRQVERVLAEAGWLGLTTSGRLNQAALPLAGLDRLTSAELDAQLGAAIASSLPPRATDFVVQADFTVVIAGLPEADLRAALVKLGTVESTGSATVIRLSERKIDQAVAAGWAAEEIESFLRRHSRTPIPQPVSYVIRDAAKRVGGPGASAEATPSSVAGLRSPVGPSVARRAPHPASVQDPAPATDTDCAPRSVILWAIRQADHAVQHGHRAEVDPAAALGPDATRVSPPANPTATTVGVIRSAMRRGLPLWVGHADPNGSTVTCMVLALRIAGGCVQTFDRDSRQMGSLVLSRINGVVALRPAEWSGLPDFVASEPR